MTSFPSPADAVDTLLELSIVGSFSRIGPLVRRRLDGWTEPPPGVLRGRTVLITGPTSGLGRAAAERLAALGARLVLVGRDPDRLAALRDDLAARHGAERFVAVVADMGSLESVARAAERILASEPRLDVVVDNAGAIFHERRLSPDGIEATFATLVVGPFALIGAVLPLLRATPGVRVISVTSGGQYAQRLDLDDLESARAPYAGTRAYARAKRAQVGLVREWARRLKSSGIRVNAMHPGWTDTPGLAEALPAFHGLMRPVLRSPAEGVDTLVWLAAAPDAGVTGGELFLDRRARPFDRAPHTRLSRADRRRLWDEAVTRSTRPDPVPDHRSTSTTPTRRTR
jgi:NAD(P)-dependent dehydrogenase (short-subunit alcohol dehydrogenase family)